MLFDLKFNFSFSAFCLNLANFSFPFFANVFFEKVIANSSAISFLFVIVFRKVIYCMGMEFTSYFFIMSHTDFVFVAEPQSYVILSCHLYAFKLAPMVYAFTHDVTCS